MVETFSLVTYTDLFYISASNEEAAAKAYLCAMKYGELEKWRPTIGEEEASDFLGSRSKGRTN